MNATYLLPEVVMTITTAINKARNIVIELTNPLPHHIDALIYIALTCPPTQHAGVQSKYNKT